MYRIAGIFRGYKCSRFSRIEPVPQKFIPTKIYNSRRVQYYGFEANGVEVQLHVDVRMRQKAGTQTTKIKSAKSFVMVHPQKFIPSKYTRYTVSIAWVIVHMRKLSSSESGEFVHVSKPL